LRRWAEKGVFERVFAALAGEPDFETVRNFVRGPFS
jgi:hypothetical protein